MVCNSKGVVTPVVPSDFAAGDGITITAGNPTVISLEIPVIPEHGGTGLTSYVLGDILYASATDTLTTLAGNTTTTKKFQSQTGDGVISAAPSWVDVDDVDVMFTDNITNDVTTSKHGYIQKLSGSSNQFFNGEGNYVTPSGTAEAYVSQFFSATSSVVVAHNFGAFPIVQVLDDSDGVQIPFSIIHSSINAFTVTFSSARTGTVLATIGSPPLTPQIDIDAGDSPYTATLDDYGINVDTTSGDVNIDLPTLSGNTTKRYLIRKKVADNVLSVTANGLDLINGTSFITITSQYTTRPLTAWSDGWGID